jgi:hypothetical protein
VVACISAMLKYGLKKSISEFQTNRFKISDQFMCSWEKHLTGHRIKSYWHTSSLSRTTPMGILYLGEGNTQKNVKIKICKTVISHVF